MIHFYFRFSICCKMSSTICLLFIIFSNFSLFAFGRIKCHAAPRTEPAIAASLTALFILFLNFEFSNLWTVVFFIFLFRFLMSHTQLLFLAMTGNWKFFLTNSFFLFLKVTIKVFYKIYIFFFYLYIEFYCNHLKFS